ncbi:MAG TPA: Holliday junction branch migration protein RuvA [Desulfitobacteriaceae bacterium]|nr:Holliday junction branch migration protein RuvA [Desulfitobacteriaceae bacterium]
MIGMLRGRVWEVQTENLILDVQGVGYQLTVPLGLLARVKTGQDLLLYTHVHVREDDLSFYGFDSLEEKRLFLLMLGVSGIGPKAALALLSMFTPEEIQAAISGENISLLTKVPGIGKKTAQRLVLELKEKFKAAIVIENKDPGVQRGISDSLETLLALGYNMAEARQALGSVKGGLADLTTEEQVKAALRVLTKEVGRDG